jgi:hypothetical protein
MEYGEGEGEEELEERRKMERKRKKKRPAPPLQLLAASATGPASDLNRFAGGSFHCFTLDSFRLISC